MACALACRVAPPDVVDTDVVDTDPVDSGDSDPPVDADGDGSPVGEDCDDGDRFAFPGNLEWCDGGDNDCDGLVDDEDPGLDLTEVPTWYPDGDGDGAGLTAGSVRRCVAPQPTGWATVTDDCDDADPTRSPLLPELCNGQDDDCDKLVDGADDDLTGDAALTGFRDQDGDGWGDPLTERRFCGLLPGGWVSQGGDCSDLAPGRNPGLPEVCGGGDEDCDLLVDDADPDVDPASLTTWAPDLDGDGHGDRDATPTLACARPPGGPWAPDALDCDDGKAEISPDAVERCGGGDEDCDDLVDDADPSLLGAARWYRDADKDGSVTSEQVRQCADPGEGWWLAGTALSVDDCDDDDGARAPHLLDDACDGVDAACTGAEVRLPEDAADLAAGLALLPSGGSLCLGPGTWAGNLVTAVPLVVHAPAGPEVTTITAADPSARMVDASAPLLVRGLTFDGEGVPGAGALHVLSDLRLDDVVIRGLRCPPERCTGLAVHAETASVDLPQVRLQDVLVEDVEEAGDHTVLRGLALRLDAPTALEGVVVRGVRSVRPSGDPATVRGLAVEMGLQAMTGTAGLLVEDVEIDHAVATEVNGGAVYRVGPFTVPCAVRGVTVRTTGTVLGGAVRVVGSVGVGEASRLDLRAVHVEADTVRGGALRVDTVRADPGAGISYEATRVQHVVVAGVDVFASTRVDGGAVSLSAGAGLARHVFEHVTVVGVAADAPGVDGIGLGFTGGSLRARAVSLVDLGATDTQADPVVDVGGWTESHSHLVAGSPPVDGGASSITGAPRFVAWTAGGDPLAWDLHLGPTSPLRNRAPTSGQDPDGTVADIGAYGGTDGDWTVLP